ncbi:hypothetical protein MJO29_007614 [Puccinia striiformis f. sp. tritici]|nr:hypothetical protein MJO29_007614 [Puccinia striiformis f. sp. tritici]
MHQPRRLYPTVSLTLIWLHFIILTDITSLPQSPANNNVGQQNKAASKLYQSVTNTAETNDSTTDHSTGPPADDPKDPNAAERNKAPLISEADSTPWNSCRSSTTLLESKASLCLQDTIESHNSSKVVACLVTSISVNSLKTGIQCASLPPGQLDKRRLRVKIVSKLPLSQARLSSLSVSVKHPNKATQRAIAALENRDVYQGKLSLNHKYRSKELGRMYGEKSSLVQ